MNRPDILDEFIADYPDMPLYLRGDSGFASPDLYEVLESKDCKYAIRLKENAKLRELAKDENQTLYHATRFNQVDYAVEYGEFMYQAGSWSHPRRIVFKIEKPYGQSFKRTVSIRCFLMLAERASRLNQLNKLYARP